MLSIVNHQCDLNNTIIYRLIRNNLLIPLNRKYSSKYNNKEIIQKIAGIPCPTFLHSPVEHI